MKTHFKSSEIAHIWVHGSAPYGQSPGAMSFGSDGFRSYGTVIAKKLEHKGKSAILRNITSYSVTTSSHQSTLWRAIPSYAIVFRIGGIYMGGLLNHVTGEMIFEYAIREAAACQDSSKKARSQNRKDALNAQVSEWLSEASKANEFFGLKRKVDGKTIQRLAASKARAELKAQKEKDARDAEDRKLQSQAYEMWKNGMPEPVHFSRPLFPIAFRVEGDELVSTLGARVPVDDAKRAIRFSKIMKDKGWDRKDGGDDRVGHYHLDSIDKNGVIAGCHRISWEEIERLDQQVLFTKEL